jgi:hypothetical protein
MRSRNPIERLRLILKKIIYVRERLRYAERGGVGGSILRHLSEA